MRGLLLAFALGLQVACARGAAVQPMEPATPAIRALPSYRTGMLKDTVFGGTAYYLEAGPEQAPAVLLVHGLGDSGLVDWFPILPALAQYHHVVAVDLPGFGRSTHASALYSPAKYVRFLHEVMRPRLPARFDLVGHSMGATLALAYAAEHPGDVQHLALLDAAAILHRHAYAEFAIQAGLSGITDSNVLGRTMSNVVSQTVVGRIPEPQMLLDNELMRRNVLQTPTRIAALAVVLENFAPAIAAVEAPTLLVWGGRDRIAPLRTGHLLEVRLAHARLAVLPDAGHDPMLAAPEALATLLREHLSCSMESPPASRRLPEATPSDRVGQCKAQNGMLFQGSYKELVIFGCHDVELRDVYATHLVINHSVVTMTASRISGPGTAVEVRSSRWEATGSDITGDTALELEASDVDLAGVRLQGTASAMHATTPSRVVFSVSELVDSAGRRQAHGTEHVGPGRP